MEDPSFNLHGIKIANIILNYFYLGLLITCFILALGNRPQGSKWGYTAALIGFAIITVYMTVSKRCEPASYPEIYSPLLRSPRSSSRSRVSKTLLQTRLMG